MTIMFETFNVPALCISYPAVLALYATGRINGCMLECGDGVTQIVPIYDGIVISHAISRLDLGGRDLTDYMVKMLNEGGYNISTSSEREIVREIKERLTFVSQEYDQDMLKHLEEAPQPEQSYELPDGNVIVVGKERFRTPEALFKPWLIGKEMPGIHQFLFDTLKKCDLDTRWKLHNIFLSGGTTACPGFIGRVKNELRALTPPAMGMRVLGPIERKHFVWIGGTTLASLRRFKELCISKAEYDEHGPSIAHTKCF
ncbi:hypothetical protein Ae201684P_016206 [Aphanomyces euteiches]|uniref:Actin n=1 Tax=Aphanomyces euteiches TaxID=100861 RepID=A0A6G0WGB3_9STRA|nr:hypothetical protein Ae201684_015729 [Aphanomyces euteiches]KAH9093579.1 hypothetical protein Ae201684P_016206 [Aphanomyces euteiches]KAH9153450.1 hypothetical protein AeRB84_004298 [Aphanomyces euteiches]